VILRIAYIFTILLITTDTKAQMIAILDDKGAPVQQAVVMIEGGAPQLTDQRGLVQIINNNQQVKMYVSHVAFEPWIGSLSDLKENIIRLRSKQVLIPEINITSDNTAKLVSESIYPVHVINKQEIQASATSHLDEILQMQPGASISRDMVMGAGISLNGMGGQNVKVLLDGVPVIGRLDGKIDASQLPLANIERIEIVNGPMSSSYGSDAAGGVINLVSEKNAADASSVDASMLYESIGTYDFRAGIGLKGNSSVVKVNLGRYFFDGWSSESGTRDQLWNPKEQYNGSLSYRYAKSNYVWSYSGFLSNEKLSDKGMPRVSPYEAYAFDQIYRTTRITNQFLGEAWFKNNGRFKGSLAHSYWRRERNTYRKDLVTLDQSAVEGLEQQDTNFVNALHSRITYQLPFAKNNSSIQIGTELQHEFAEGKRIQEGKAEVGEYAVFASLEFQPYKALQIKPSLRYGYRTDFEMPLIPSLAIKYDVNKSIAVRAGYGKGFRAPSIKERYLYFVDVNHNVRGNEALQPEISDNIYGGVDFILSNRSETKLSAGLNGFSNSIEQEIVLAQPNATSNLYTYVNIGSTKVLGSGISLSFSKKGLSTSVGWTLYGKEQSLDGGSSGMLNYSEAFARASYHIKKHKLSIDAWFKYNGSSPGYILNNNNTITTYENPSYSMFDMAVSKRILMFAKLQLGVRNLLNVTDVNASVTGSAHNDGSGTIAVGTGRTYFLKLSFDWSFKNQKNRND
jgi:outer membrane receptor for ferrienterochelin and colicins